MFTTNSFLQGHCRTMAALRIMFLGCALIALSLKGVKAQSNHEYNFRQQFQHDGDSYGNNSDPVPILSMDCLAANGFGQWTLSSTSNNGNTWPNGWYLLANGLYKPSVKYDPASDHPECIPPGVVQNGTLAGSLTPAEPEVTANLDGSVCYVWPEPVNRRTFQAQGFSPTDLDLTFRFCLWPVPPMNVITQPILSWPDIPTGPQGNEHDIISTASYRDEYDVTSDAKYLYIVWTSNQHMSSGVTSSEVWATVVDLSTHTALLGWPKSLGEGHAPTVACDPRGNRGISNSPQFDVAFISYPVNVGVPNWLTWNNSLGAFVSRPLEKWFIKPDGTEQPYGYAKHVRALVSSVPNVLAAHHALYVITDNGIPDESYLIFYNPDNPNYPRPTIAAFVDGDLIGSATPVPGPSGSSPPGWPVQDAPIVAFSNPYDNGDNQNEVPPNWREFDQFHCVYQLRTINNPLVIVRGCDNGLSHPAPLDPNWPLNDTRLVLNQNSSGMLQPDPITKYVGAVNQMGIHIHWRTVTNIHYYSRDLTRTFDEDIDENTLVTDVCTCSDGRAHGGTLGAQLVKDCSMSVWTDPNYGYDPNDAECVSTLYQPYNNTFSLTHWGFTPNPYAGQINFDGKNVALNVGSTTDDNATLTVMPNFFFNFNRISPYDQTGQTVNVFPGSRFDYMGHPSPWNHYQPSVYSMYHMRSAFTLHNDVHYNDSDGASFNLLDFNAHGGAELLIEPGACFIVNAGFTLNVGDRAYVFCDYGSSTDRVDHLRQQDNVTGSLFFRGRANFDANYNHSLTSAIPSGHTEQILTFAPGYSGTQEQFYAKHTIFDNMIPEGAGEIFFESSAENGGGPDGPLGPVLIDDVTFSAMKIHSLGALSGTGHIDGSFKIQNCTFANQHGRTISFVSGALPTGGSKKYYDFRLSILNNDFTSISSTLDADDYYYGTYGIYLKNFDANFNGQYSDMIGNILISGNTFTSDNSSIPLLHTQQGTYNLAYCAAIMFENTTGNIIDNVISDPFYTNGIWLWESMYNGSLSQTNTLVCNNTISHLHPNPFEHWTGSHWPICGIQVSSHIGHLTLNTITDCQFGIRSAGFANNSMAYNTVNNYQPTYNRGYGIESGLTLTEAPSTGNYLDMTNSGSGGHNTIKATFDNAYGLGWASGLIQLDQNSGILLSNGHNNMFLSLPGHPNPGPSTQPAATYPLIFRGTGPSYMTTMQDDMDYNFFGLDWNSSKIDPLNEPSPSVHAWIHGVSWQQQALNIILPSLPSATLSSLDTWSNGSCGSYALRTKDEGHAILSVSSDSSCLHSYEVGRDAQRNKFYKTSYDTLRAFINRCPFDDNAPHAFGILTGDVQNGANGVVPECWSDFRAWLLSALSWNTRDTRYFCADVETISNTFGYFGSSWDSGNAATNKSLSVIRWLIQNSACSNKNDSVTYDNARIIQKAQWRAQDTNVVKLDTTLPSMHDLGLDSVLFYASLLQNSSGVNVQGAGIEFVTANPNPSNQKTTISFGITRESLVKIEILDVLGVRTSIGIFQAIQQPGNNSIEFDLSGLSPGLYFVRVSSPTGTRTVKVVKK